MPLPGFTRPYHAARRRGHQVHTAWFLTPLAVLLTLRLCPRTRPGTGGEPAVETAATAPAATAPAAPGPTAPGQFPAWVAGWTPSTPPPAAGAQGWAGLPPPAGGQDIPSPGVPHGAPEPPDPPAGAAPAAPAVTAAEPAGAPVDGSKALDPIPTADAFAAAAPPAVAATAESSLVPVHLPLRLPPGGGECPSLPPAILPLARSLLGRRVKVRVRGQRRPLAGTVMAVKGTLLILCRETALLWVDLRSVVAIQTARTQRRRPGRLRRPHRSRSGHRGGVPVRVPSLPIAGGSAIRSGRGGGDRPGTRAQEPEAWRPAGDGTAHRAQAAPATQPVSAPGTLKMPSRRWTARRYRDRIPRSGGGDRPEEEAADAPRAGSEPEGRIGGGEAGTGWQLLSTWRPPSH